MALNKLVRWSYLNQYSPVSECRVVELASLLFPNPWGKIDLLAVYKVRAITISNLRRSSMEIEIFIKKLDNDLDNDM